MSNNVIRLYPVPAQKPEKTKPLKWVLKLIHDYKKKYDELRRKKIDFLVEQLYFYYLIIKLSNKDLAEVDFHPSLYASGIVIDYKCQRAAIQAVIDNVLVFGKKRIDESFSKAVKQFAKNGTYKHQALKLTGDYYYGE